MHKKIFSIIAIFGLILFMAQTIYAVSNSDKMACTLSSSRYLNANEIELSMLTARLAYQMKGYHTVGHTDPSGVLTTSNALSNHVQLYFCHGSYQLLAFESGGRFDCGAFTL